ncbi:c-type cytochrome [Gilvibacter sp.]|uniref:c-type cytochrome n=1 Tax=Gilvibacter sp. TaxID=2729997 RepID=UPI003F4A253B
MKRLLNLSLIFAAALSLVGCFDESKPNYQYMPNMYEPVGYETYGEYEIFENEQEAMLPVDGTIPRGWMPYDYPNTLEGKEMASAELTNPHPVTQENLDKGKELYDIYCAVCHGTKGDGQGILMKNEVFLGIPSYADRVVTDGNVYHVMMYGLNSMGSYASQTNELERWQITMHVRNLTAALTGGEPLTVVEPMEDAMDSMDAMSDEAQADEAHDSTDEAH